MKIKEKFRQAFILALHPKCKAYEEAVMEESDRYTTECFCNECNKKVLKDMYWKYICCNITFPNVRFEKKYTPLPITIDRVMKALEGKCLVSLFETGQIRNNEKNIDICQWKLTKENTKSCTEDDQTEETLKTLTDLITNT